MTVREKTDAEERLEAAEAALAGARAYRQAPAVEARPIFSGARLKPWHDPATVSFSVQVLQGKRFYLHPHWHHSSQLHGNATTSDSQVAVNEKAARTREVGG